MAFHILTVLSSDALATVPSFRTISALTEALWPTRVLKIKPLVGLTTLIVPSPHPLAKVPSFKTAKDSDEFDKVTFSVRLPRK